MMCDIFDGQHHQPLYPRNTFFYDKTPSVARHQLRRDFPEEGDCTYVGQAGRPGGQMFRFRVGGF